MKKKILKLLGFKRCYFCNKWTRNWTILYVPESPKDVEGIPAPFCKGCAGHIQEKSY